MTERPISPRVEASRRAKDDKRAWIARRTEELSKKQEDEPARPSFFRNPIGYLFGVEKQSSDWVERPRVFLGTAENYEERLTEAKGMARLTMLEENYEYAEGFPVEYHRFPIAGYLEEALKQNNLPSVIISEDVSGRLMAKTLSVFLTKLRQRIDHSFDTVPVIAYPVGRSTPIEMRPGYAQDVRKKLDASHKGASILIVTDILEKGNTIRPLLEALVRGGFSIGVLVTRINFAQKELLNTLNTPPELKFLTALAPINRGTDSDMRSLARNDAPTDEVPNALLTAELPEERERRLKMIEEVAEVLYETFLERPGVAAYLKTREPN